MIRRMLAALMAILMTAAGAPAWAADCGDTAGAGGTRVACDCGDTVITSATLQAADPVVNNVCTAVGLTIGADNITLNCSELEIVGDPNDDGILLEDRTGVTVRNCRVTGFVDGIQLLFSSGNTLVFNTISGSDDVGIDLEESNDNNVIKANRVVAAAFDAINVSDGGTGNVIENNVLEAAGVSEEDGVDFDCCGVSGNTVKGNQVSGFGNSGIELESENDGNAVTENRAGGNEHGIRVFSNGNTIARNLTDGNLEDGIFVSGNVNTIDTNRGKLNGDDGLEVTGLDNTVIRNVFDSNGDVGICVVPGNIDGGGNRGKGNGTLDVSFAC